MIHYVMFSHGQVRTTYEELLAAYFNHLVLLFVSLLGPSGCSAIVVSSYLSI